MRTGILPLPRPRIRAHQHHASYLRFLPASRHLQPFLDMRVTLHQRLITILLRLGVLILQRPGIHTQPISHELPETSTVHHQEHITTCLDLGFSSRLDLRFALNQHQASYLGSSPMSCDRSTTPQHINHTINNTRVLAHSLLLTHNITIYKIFHKHNHRVMKNTYIIMLIKQSFSK